MDVRRRLAERADDEPAHVPELAQAAEDRAVAGATRHAAADGVDVARVSLMLAGDRARARFDGRASRRVDAVGVGVARAVDVVRLGVVVRAVAGGELHARVGRDRVLRRPLQRVERVALRARDDADEGAGGLVVGGEPVLVRLCDEEARDRVVLVLSVRASFRL